MSLTLHQNTFIVATAFPDPPFDVIDRDNGFSGFDIELISEIAALLKLTLKIVPYTGEDFNGIFDGLINQQYDAVISGTTITAARAEKVLFTKPYLEFNQGIAINHAKTPNVSAEEDLKGLVAGIQKGNTSDAVAKELKSRGLIADIHYYSYHQIEAALMDLQKGKIGLVIKLFPVISSLIKEYPELSVAMQVPTQEKIGIAVAKGNQPLCSAMNQALDTLKENSKIQTLALKWFSDATCL